MDDRSLRTILKLSSSRLAAIPSLILEFDPPPLPLLQMLELSDFSRALGSGIREKPQSMRLTKANWPTLAKINAANGVLCIHFQMIFFLINAFSINISLISKISNCHFKVRVGKILKRVADNFYSYVRNKLKVRVSRPRSLKGVNLGTCEFTRSRPGTKNFWISEIMITRIQTRKFDFMDERHWYEKLFFYEINFETRAKSECCKSFVKKGFPCWYRTNL